jgi:omega-6 fatty acid desaturase (delta-12 desaturase)
MNSEVITHLRNYANADERYAAKLFFGTLSVHLVLTAASYYLYTISPWLSLLFWIPMGIVLCRFFVLEHDAGHQSLFKNRKYNRYSGMVLGFFTMIPNVLWNHIHDVHHGVVGNLDQRKRNPELWTMTCEEYKKASFRKKILYRFVRSIFMRLILTPALWIIVPRIPLFHLGRKILISILVHNLLYGLLFYWLFRQEMVFSFVVVYLVPLYLFNFLASVFFYLQHQYEDTKWKADQNWNLYEASIHGSSYLISNRIFTWISGNVGCHHVHHLNTKIPHYHLQEATASVNPYLEIEPIYLKDLFHHLSCVLYDERTEMLISFREFKKKYAC